MKMKLKMAMRKMAYYIVAEDDVRRDINSGLSYKTFKHKPPDCSFRLGVDARDIVDDFGG